MKAISRRLIVNSVILLAVVSRALADSGTALLVLEMAHLYVLNFVITAIEAFAAYLILALIFRMRSRLIGWLLLANLSSYFAGFFLLSYWVDLVGGRVLGDHPLANLPDFMVETFLFAFLITVLIEWPFVHIGIARWARVEENAGMRWKRRLPALSFVTNLVMQVISYLGLAYLYFNASNAFLVSEVKIERTPAFIKTPQAVVYYKRLDGKGYSRVRIDGSKPEPVILTKVEFEQKVKDYYGKIPTSNVGFIPAIDFRPVPERQIGIFDASWGRIAICDEHKKTTVISLEIPFFQWYTGYPTALPGDQLVFETGKCLVVYDIHTRQLYELALGYHPVVFIPGVKYQPPESEAITPP